MTDAAPDLIALARRVETLAPADADLLALASSLRAAATSSRPAAALAKSLRLQVNRRSPARQERNEAFARMAACARYAGKAGKPLYAAMLLDLQRYAASSAWRADRTKAFCPYLPSDWHAHAWQALRMDGAVPRHWKTIMRARGHILVVHGPRASSPTSTEA